MTLYRIGNPQLAGAFWSPDVEYVRAVKGENSPVVSAELSPAAVIKQMPGSPDKTVIHVERLAEQADVLVFKAWDWDTDEYIVLNPAVLSNIKPFTAV
jgi:hypothetical protein